MSAIDGPSVELWGDLRRTPPESMGAFAAHELRVDGVRCGLYMAIGHDMALHLFIPVDGHSDGSLPVRLNGLEVHERKVLIRAADASLFVDVCSTPAYEAMFTTVAREVAQAVAVERMEPRRAAIRTIRRWQTFWRPPRSAKLTRAQQLGLFGEVLWLNRILLPLLGPEAVYRWTGPNGERHDFQGASLHVEVKVTERSQPVFRISGLEQLDPPDGKCLALGTVMVREESGAADGLVQEVASCEANLASHIAELEAFHDRLASVGYRRESESEWDKLRVLLRAADLYVVDAGFPRLSAERLVGGCPPGVGEVVYDVDLAMVTPRSSEDTKELLEGLRVQ